MGILSISAQATTFTIPDISPYDPTFVTTDCEVFDASSFTLKFNTPETDAGYIASYSENAGNIESVIIESISIAPSTDPAFADPALYPAMTLGITDTLGNPLTLPYSAPVNGLSSADIGIRLSSNVALPPCIDSAEQLRTEVDVEIDFRVKSVAGGISEYATFRLFITSTEH